MRQSYKLIKHLTGMNYREQVVFRLLSEFYNYL